MSSSRSSVSSRSSSSGTAAPPSRIADIVPPTRMLQDARFKLFLRVHSGQNLQSSTQGTYCKLYLGDTIMVSGSQSALMQFNLLNDSATAKAGGANAAQGADAAHPTHRVFRTHVEYPKQPAHPVWNEKFEVGVFDPTKEVVSIRVKSQQMIYCPTIGACAIYLKQLKLGETVDQWFPLHKGQRGAGHIRLQLHLSMNANARVIQQPVATKAVSMATPANANAIALQKKREEEMLRQKRQAEKEAAMQREEEERRQRRKAEKEKEKARLRAEEEEEERRRQKRKAEKKEKARLRAEEEEKEHRRRELAEKERMLRAVRAAEEAAAAEKEERQSVKSHSSGKQIYVCSSDEEEIPREGKKSDNQDEEGMHQALEEAAVKVVEAMANAFDSDGDNTIEYVSESNLVSSSSSAESPKKRSSQSAKTKKKPSSRTSSRSSKQSFSATVQSIEDAIQRVEQNALPSDSSDDDSSSSSSMSSEEERRLLRKLKEKKKRRKEKKAKRKAKKKKSKSKMADSDSDSDSSSSSSSSSSSLSSSSSTSSGEKRKRKDKKKSKMKSSKKDSRKSQGSRKSSPKSSKPSKNKDTNDNGTQWGEYISAAGDIASLYSTLTGGNNQDSGAIEAIPQQDGGFDMSSMGDWIQAASSVSDLMSVSDDPTDQTAAVVGVMTAGIVPLGKYLGKKIRQASVNSQQRHQQQDQQFVCQINSQQAEQLQMAVEVQSYDDAIGAGNNNYEYVGEQQTESTYYF